MIESFKDRRLKHFYERGDSSKIQPALVGRVETILGRLDIALTLDDIDVHSFHLDPLTGDLIRILEYHSSSQLADYFPFRKR